MTDKELQCPELPEVEVHTRGGYKMFDLNHVTIDDCEGMAMGQGCKYKDSCDTYRRLKGG